MGLSFTSTDSLINVTDPAKRVWAGTVSCGSTFAAAGEVLSPATLGNFTDPVTSAVVAPKFNRFDQVIIGAPVAYNGTTTAKAIMATWNPATQIMNVFTEDQTSGVTSVLAATTDLTLSKFPVLIVGA